MPVPSRSLRPDRVRRPAVGATVVTLLLGLLLAVPVGHAADADRDAVAAAERAPRAVWVTLRTTTPRPTVGDRVRLVGKTRAARGSKVRIEVRAPQVRKWSRVGTTRVKARKRFRWTTRSEKVGVHRYRACVVAKGSRRCARPVAVKVLEDDGSTPPTPQPSPGAPAWYYLADGGPVAEAAGDWCPVASDTVGGVPVLRSIGFGITCKDDNEAEVDLGGRCTAFEARIGLSDDPAKTTPNVRYRVTILADGVQRFHQPAIEPGQAWDVSLDLTGVQRLRLEVPFVSGTSGLVVLGGARVWCQF